MRPPVPIPGLVVRFGFLWSHDRAARRDEAVKDRPCAVLLSAKTATGGVRVYVLPITHRPPDRPNCAMEIPDRVRRHLGLDDERSWIVLDEVNDFIWPGFDLVTIPGSHPERTDYGVLPPAFFRKVRDAFVVLFNSRRINVVQRD